MVLQTCRQAGAQDGVIFIRKGYDTTFYNLDVIISVGYRVKSLRGTHFRIWAIQRLKEYIVKGFTLSGSYYPVAAFSEVNSKLVWKRAEKQ